MTVDVYENCPIYENEYYMLRMTNKEDKADLLKVYSDEKSVPFFNSDNCGGDDFYYTTEKRMEQAIEFWHWEYDRQGFVRWTIVSKETNEAVGTIELFHREAEDYFTNCGLLRLDIRSDYEITSEIVKILELIIEPAYVLFQCDKIATYTESVNDLARHSFDTHTDTEVLGAALCLRRPVFVGGDLHLAHRIVFCSEFHHITEPFAQILICLMISLRQSAL